MLERRSLRKNKRGDFTDMLIFLITLFVLGVGLFIFAFAIPAIADGLNQAGLNSTTETANAIDSMASIGNNTIQRGFFFLFIGLIMGVMITSFFTRQSPIFLFLYILLLGLAVFLAIFIGNAYDTLTENPALANTLTQNTLINVVFNNIITIMIAVGALSMIIVFSKFGGGGRAIPQRL